MEDHTPISLLSQEDKNMTATQTQNSNEANAREEVDMM